MTYTYKPTCIRDGGLHQMRFELGDTAVEEGALGCGLSDEEYLAFLLDMKPTKKTWNSCKLSLLKGILHKFAFQVDTKIDVLEYDFSSRVTQWKTLCDALEEEINLCAVPVLGGTGGKTYFYEGMMSHLPPSQRTKRGGKKSCF